MERRIRQSVGFEFPFSMSLQSVLVTDTLLTIDSELEIYQNDSCTGYASVVSNWTYLDSLWEIVDGMQFRVFDPDCGVDPGDTAGFCVTYKSHYRRLEADSL